MYDDDKADYMHMITIQYHLLVWLLVGKPEMSHDDTIYMCIFN